MFSCDNATATVKRHGYSDGKSTGLVDVGTYKGYLTPESENSVLLTGETLGDVYRFSTKRRADFKKGDILVIDGEEYSVKGVLHKRGCSIRFSRAYIVHHGS